MARTSPERTPARMATPTYAVWETTVFALNIFAFIFIGLQLRPILESGGGGYDQERYFVIAGAVLLTVIIVRIVWQMSFNAVMRWRHRQVGLSSAAADAAPNGGYRLDHFVVGMRGIVSLAAAFALPSGFPYRDLIVLTAFSVVLGTLVIQGLTLKPLLHALDLHEIIRSAANWGRPVNARCARDSDSLGMTTRPWLTQFAMSSRRI